MRLLISLGAGAIGVLALRAIESSLLATTLHPIINFLLGFAILVVAWRLLGLLPWLGPSAEEREYREQLRSFFEQKSPDWIDRRFIYVESGYVRHVRVSKVRVGGQGLSVTMHTLPGRGFAPGSMKFTVSTRWDTVYVRESYVCEPNIPWELLTDEQASEQIVKEVALSAKDEESPERSLEALRVVRSRLAASTVISNSELREEMIPSDNAPLIDVAGFGLSYDLKSGGQERDDKFFLRLLGQYTDSGSLPSSLDDARALLCYVQMNSTPGYRTEPVKIERDLIRSIRASVRSQKG